jgi:hypothetical protein
MTNSKSINFIFEEALEENNMNIFIVDFPFTIKNSQPEHTSPSYVLLFKTLINSKFEADISPFLNYYISFKIITLNCCFTFPYKLLLEVNRIHSLIHPIIIFVDLLNLNNN